MDSEAFTIGIICALPIECTAVLTILDEEYPQLPEDVYYGSRYQFGRIGVHEIVIGCLSSGKIGVVEAASIASKMRSSFPNIRVGLMVGVGGGVPSEEHDIRLGDVVVSQPTGVYGGVVQYDAGKALADEEFERTGILCPPPDVLLDALTLIHIAQERGTLHIATHLSRFDKPLPSYCMPTEPADQLYLSTHLHKGGKNCLDCGTENAVYREERDSKLPVVHYGTIASGNLLMRDATKRDKISQELGGVLCFEMEAAGLMNLFPCLVVRGIADYADSHKKKNWQRYAAATAAAFAREVIDRLAPFGVIQARTITQAMDEMSKQLARNTDVTQQIKQNGDRKSC